MERNSNPFLRGWNTAELLGNQRGASQLAALSGLMSLQGMGMQQNAMLRREADQAAQQERLTQFAASLPEPERQKFMVAPMEYIKELNKRYAVGGSLVTGGGNEVFKAPDKPILHNVPVQGQPGVTQPTWLLPGQATGTAVGGMNMPEILNPAVQQAKVGVAQAGRPVTNVNVNTGKTFGEAMGREFGAMIPQQRGEATGALQSIDAANQIQRAIDSGSVIAGPTATLRIKGNQVANMLGFSGPDAIVETRKTIQGLSKLALGARQALKGQGQITEYEQKLLEKAEAGNIDDLTIPEIRTIAQIADKAGRLKIKQFNELGAGLANTPEYEPLRQFFNVPEPTPYAPARRASDKATGQFRILGQE